MLICLKNNIRINLGYIAEEDVFVVSLNASEWGRGKSMNEIEQDLRMALSMHSCVVSDHHWVITSLGFMLVMKISKWHENTMLGRLLTEYHVSLKAKHND